MHVIVAVAAAGLAVAGCSKGEVASTNTTTTTTATEPAGTGGGFTPPTTASRADYGGRIERRFRKLDADGDGKLEKGELPAQRADRMLRRMDTNGDGAIDAAEWSAAMLARFDRQDANKDGNLTSDERGKRGGGKRQQRQMVTDVDDTGDEGDNGF